MDKRQISEGTPRNLLPFILIGYGVVCTLFSQYSSQSVTRESIEVTANARMFSNSFASHVIVTSRTEEKLIE
jgi:hypothetical protein